MLSKATVVIRIRRPAHQSALNMHDQSARQHLRNLRLRLGQPPGRQRRLLDNNRDQHRVVRSMDGAVVSCPTSVALVVILDRQIQPVFQEIDIPLDHAARHLEGHTFKI